MAARSDRVLDAAVLAFAAWTAIYQACLVARVGAPWALTAAVLAVGPCLAVAFGGARAAWPRDPDVATGARPRGGRLRPALLAIATLTAAAGFAFLRAPWPVVIGAWLVAAGAALVSPPRRVGGPTGDGAAVALAWAVALAALSQFLVNPNEDDGQYVHLASWVAAHGSFPIRDTLFSDQALPAIFFPPLNSYEALLGSIARMVDLPARDLVYFAVPPVASALAVAALWRLLRAWRVRTPALALSVALAFLVLDAAGMRTFGSFWVTRMWQGKVIFVAVLMPVLFALLHEYAVRPTRRGLLLLAAAGVAGVGLTTTAMFVVPVAAAGCLAPLLRSAPRRAFAALVATAGYPLAAGATTLVLGGRNPQSYTAAEVVPRALAHDVLGRGPLAFIAVAAVLAGPALIRSAVGARMAAGAALTVGLLFVPGVTLTLFRLTGLGEVLWRLTWALPVAALVGVLGSEALQGARLGVAHPVPAIVIAGALIAWGTPLWSPGTGTTVSTSPRWKVASSQLVRSRRVLAAARAGDVILAPRPLSVTILELSGTLVVVDPNDRYARALHGIPGAYEGERLLLERFVAAGLAPLAKTGGRVATGRRVGRALRDLRVDLACVKPRQRAARALLVRDGFAPVIEGRPISCLRRADDPSGRTAG